MGLRKVWAAAAVAGAVAVSGCGIDKAEERAQQLDAIGDVVVRTTFCTSGDMDGDSHACAPYERAHRGQALVAYRIPAGSEAPEAFDSDGGALHFTRSTSYAAFMQAGHARAGMRWVAYVSDPYSLHARGQAAFTVSPRLTLPDAGKPFEGPYRYTVAGGYRELLEAGDDGSAAVDCENGAVTECVSAEMVGDDSEFATRDLGVLGGVAGGEEPVVEAGSDVAVPFDLRYAGAAVDAARFSLSASTDLDGGAVALSQEAIEPASDSHNPVAAVVSVPEDTAPGDYEVTLTATAPGGSDGVIFRAGSLARAAAAGDRTQLRSGVMRFRVVAPQRRDDPAPVETPPVKADDPPPEPPLPAAPPEPPVPGPPDPDPARAAPRAVLGLSLAALPRRAYNGDYATYLVMASNRSQQPARGMRVCETLPGRVQFVQASRRARFTGRRLCFRRTRLPAGGSMAALVYVHVDTDARPGMARARATATARNASRASARAHLRVVRRAAEPRRAPVTG
jgi:uncharacterized repeat protein (TIGR01451 family)